MSPSVVASLNAGPTQWENLGDWSQARRYPDACRALAERVARSAALRGGEALLDLGCGWGEQLAVWRELGAARVVGCEPCPTRAAAARARGLGEVAQRRAEALLQGLEPSSFDVVLAVDSAYHVPRRALLIGAARVLRPGGRLALATLLRPEGSSTAARALTRLAGRVCRLAPDALATPSRWRADLERGGFEAARVSPLDDVLAGFARHARGRGPRRVAVTARLCAAAARTGWLGYGVIAARRAS